MTDLGITLLLLLAWLALLPSAAVSAPARAAAVLLGMVNLLWFLIRGRRNHPGWAELEQYAYAHRGLHRKPDIPENSLSAFRRAADAGFGAELDVHLTRDGRLAVIHDSALRRTCGVSGNVEDFTAAQLSRFRLEGTDETIPLLDEVLPLFEGRAPLIVELKPARGNHGTLAEKTVECLDCFSAHACIESFDPRCLFWLRRHRPEILRGQLTQNFRIHPSGLPGPLRLALTYLMADCLSRPDFIARRFEDRRNWTVRLLNRLGAVREADWTLRSQRELDQAERERHLIIFEDFLPLQKEKEEAAAR